MAALDLCCCTRAFSSCGGRGYSSMRCAGLPLWWLLLLQSAGSRHKGFSSSCGSVAVTHGLRCSTACGLFPDQGSNPCPLHWQADSQPLRHQGSPCNYFYFVCFFFFLIYIYIFKFLFIYLFIYGCVGSLLLHSGFL